MLLGNGTLLNKCPIRFLAGSAASTENMSRAAWQKNGMERNRFYRDQATTAYKTWGEPTASYPPYCYTIIPQCGSWLSSRREAWANFPVAGDGLRGLSGVGAAVFTVTPNAPLGKRIMLATGVVSFAVTTNSAPLVASLAANGSADTVLSTNTPILGAIADLTTAATFGIATNNPMIYPINDASPLRAGTVVFALSASLTRYALGHLIGAALPYTELSPQSLAAAVWDASMLDFQRDGSTGKALSTASTGGVDVGILSDAVVAALEDTTIPVNAVMIKGQVIQGAGTEADPWGP